MILFVMIYMNQFFSYSSCFIRSTLLTQIISTMEEWLNQEGN